MKYQDIPYKIIIDTKLQSVISLGAENPVPGGTLGKVGAGTCRRRWVVMEPRQIIMSRGGIGYPGLGRLTPSQFYLRERGRKGKIIEPGLGLDFGMFA